MRHLATLALTALGVGAAACSSTNEPPVQSGTPAAVSIVSGNGQTGLVGTTLTLPLAVKVTSTTGASVGGATVTFAVTSGTATISPASATTDTAGVAKTTVTLGAAAGNIVISATLNGTSLSTVFTVAAGSGTLTAACSTGAALTPSAGSVLPAVSGSGVCLSGGTGGADYAIAAFNGNSNPATLTSLTVKSAGATPLVTADVAASFDAVSQGMSPFTVRPTNLRDSFDAQLRYAARRELTPLIPAARAEYAASSRRPANAAAFSAIPSDAAVGQTITLNAQSSSLSLCSNAINIRARVVAKSNTALVVADSTNPAGGFTDAEYAAFATTFDTLINPLDVANFGSPTDIDKNGRVVIFFTKEVNKLTPRNSGSLIGGFFIERDLFPTTTQNGFEGCATSNVGEMFYVLVPDPAGVYSDVRAKSDVLSETYGTLAHEYQHLINAGRRLYVNNAPGYEEVWLDEGLAHVAEELLYYRATGKAPRQNLGHDQIAATPTLLAQFNSYQADNLGRYQIFLSKPPLTSPYADNDALETRGATWNLLRYLVDHQSSNDADVWSRLVNTTLAGQANLANVFGSTYLTQIRDWATSVFADDVAGVTDARFLQPSWNMRAIFPFVDSGNGVPLGRFPLSVVPVTDVTPASLLMFGGGTSYLRFTVAAGKQASIDWSASGLPVSPLVQFTVVRTR